ncbi:rho GTPase-activating protein 15-like isoform X2 [Xenia sp. Carnegie-2017]|uniref:rho GTPase-activating protein 15-like isoform X2 n=1 Tax=Xenia sp. Carnegie-2017 TaxID=2897299 RepID=UPI001F03535D|nr:rho GTPase-activating protein 15-like isoform X2 [Xenia sp. Carnegie-2017]
MLPTQKNGDALVSRSSSYMGNAPQTFLVRALYSYSYEFQPGQYISFEAGDCFVLVEKSNDDWWHVKKGEQDIYVPANYMTESQIEFGDHNSANKLHNHSLPSPSSDYSFHDNCKEISNNNNENNTSFSGGHSRKIVNVNDQPERIYANVSLNVPESRRIRHLSAGAADDQKQALESSRPQSVALPSGWSSEIDNKSGRTYYINNKTNKTFWQHPSDGTSVELPNNATQNSNSLPRGWRMERQTSNDYNIFYVNESNNEKWQASKDVQGRTYYYNTKGDTVWELPSNEQVSTFFKSGHKRTSSDQTRSSLILSDDFHPSTIITTLDYSIKKEGNVYRKKLCEVGGRKVNKNWKPCYVKLSSTNITLYKNENVAQSKQGLAKGMPDSGCDLRGAVVQRVPDEGKRKNIFQITTATKLCFLLQVDDIKEFNAWYSLISDVVKFLEESEPVEKGLQARLYGDVTPATHRNSLPATGGITRRGSKKSLKLRGESDKKIRDKLKKLMTKRPTFEELQKKGILKDVTFGCHISKLCALEQSKIPKVVIGCIQAIENKGLDFDGMYRISGNASLIQKLRLTVDQEEDVVFGQPPYDDIHVLTGTLKLYFRELPEPLIPFNVYDNFINAIRLRTKQQKSDALRAQVEYLPSPNNETLRYLMKHLKRVMENNSKNRMHAHNIAIVFGPTLLSPKEEQFANIAVNTVYQNQVVEFLLLEYDQVLGSDY